MNNSSRASGILKAWIVLFGVYVLTMPLMNFAAIPVLGHQVQFGDFLFIPLALLSVYTWFKTRPELDLPLLLASGFVILSLLIALIPAGNLLKGFARLVIQSYLIMLFWVSYLMARSIKNLRPVFLSGAWSTAVVVAGGIAGVILYYCGWKELDDNLFLSSYGLALPRLPLPRLRSFTLGGEYLANFLIPGFFFLYYEFKTGNRFLRKKLILFPVIAGFLLTDLLSLSQAFFLWIVPLLAWKTIFPGRKIARWKTRAGATAIILIMIEVALGSFYIISVHKPGQLQSAQSHSSRFGIKPNVRRLFWRAAISEIKEHPVLGRGLDRLATGPLKLGDCPECDLAQGADAHNLILNLWSTRGLPGMIGFLIFLALVLVKSGRAALKPSASLEIQVLFAAAIGLILTSFFVDIEDFRHLYLCLGLLAGLSGRSAQGAAGPRPCG